MIEINLIPDIKREFLRNQRMRARVILGSITVCLAAGGLIVGMFLVLGAQELFDKSASENIEKKHAELTTSYPNLNNIATIQSQVESVSALNEEKQIMSRLTAVLGAIRPPAPNEVSISEVTVNPEEKTLTLQGVAPGGFNVADAFRKTIERTNLQLIPYGKTAEDKETLPLTGEVSLGELGFGEDSSGRRVLSFTMSFTYNENLFANLFSSVEVSSPTGVVNVTDSRLRVPDDLFAEAPKPIEEEK